jgi:hypothetical protein
MAMVTVTWAAAAEVIITDGAEDAVIITAGHAVDITTAIETRTGGRFLRPPVYLDFAAGQFAIGPGIEDQSCQQR